MIHITNYSIQKYSDKFSSYEYGNEVSFNDFQHYLNYQYGFKKVDVRKTLWKRFIEIIKISCKSVYKII